MLWHFSEEEEESRASSYLSFTYYYYTTNSCDILGILLPLLIFHVVRSDSGTHINNRRRVKGGNCSGMSVAEKAPISEKLKWHSF